MVAIGKRGPRENLPDEVAAKEAPNQRKPLREILFEGTFGAAVAGLSPAE